ncbi:helix-turn-helix transcriptional regulator [Amycolatopsis sp. QT-25]|uniref:helix-turn-helix transcriptional regulator n=1 Tax=Amycolatopsis sp. QT-25 TaxID=3034022 RepID=UPI0023EB6AB8|nr:helix-turn-helix transcriptional regulator [Amycolatopsis sp. QT-25]WET81604.1 helix-turn-helix transcriptional regulator [Amycolatopsis sp. QT-25]
MSDERELGRFLRSRRARAAPERAGATGRGPRRVSGLRRDEVAQLAGISVEYYVRLEQGRALRPSAGVVDALAVALDLDDAERAHVHDLATMRRRPSRPYRRARARPELVGLLQAMSRVPALVYDHRMDVLAWNRLAAQLFIDFAAAPVPSRNLARFCFLDPESRDRFVDWADVARATVGQLRLASGRYGDDEGLAQLVGELAIGSETFRSLWAGRDVRERTHGEKRFRHPLVGELTLRFENFDLPGGTGQRLVTFTAPAGAAGAPAAAALGLLAMWDGSRDASRGADAERRGTDVDSSGGGAAVPPV